MLLNYTYWTIKLSFHCSYCGYFTLRKQTLTLYWHEGWKRDILKDNGPQRGWYLFRHVVEKCLDIEDENERPWNMIFPKKMLRFKYKRYKIQVSNSNIWIIVERSKGSKRVRADERLTHLGSKLFCLLPKSYSANNQGLIQDCPITGSGLSITHIYLLPIVFHYLLGADHHQWGYYIYFQMTVPLLSQHEKWDCL
jgi:hypothetical protein